MLESEPPPTLDRPDWSRIRDAYLTFVAPCGAPAINHLEQLLERKFALVQQLVQSPEHLTPGLVPEILRTVLATRAHRESILAETPRERFHSIALDARRPGLLPNRIPTLASRLSGAPDPVLCDLAAEIVHAVQPDRLGLLTRWVWNPERRSGVLGELVEPVPVGTSGAQAAMGQIRLQLGALGFPSPTFASVDILLAMAYAARLSQATDRSFQGGGIESLLPGPYGIACMVLGVRRWVTHADS